MQSPAPRSAIQVILNEHAQLSAVIEGMLRFVQLLEAGAKTPGLMVFRAMIFYIREYPEQVHHPKEDRYLFARLRDRTNDLDDVLAELEFQHAQGEVRVLNVEHALTRYELKGEPAFPALRILAREYAEFYLKHRRLEEEVILPAARRLLTSEDWVEIDAAFGANRDPFDGVKVEEDLDKLFAMIVQTIPAVADY